MTNWIFFNFFKEEQTSLYPSKQIPICALDNADKAEILSKENIGLKQSKQKKVFLKLRQYGKPPTMAMGYFWEPEDPPSSAQLRNSGEAGSLQKLPINWSFCQQELETLLAHTSWVSLLSFLLHT